MRRRTVPAASLRGEPFFHDLDEETLARIESYVYHRDYEPRQVIFFPDDPCDYAYWVRKGRVRIARQADTGREVTFRHLYPGDFFGEECLLDLPTCGVCAEAMDDTTLCLLRADDFRRICRDVGLVSWKVSLYLCERVLRLEGAMAEFVFNPVRSRIASCLLYLVSREKSSEAPVVLHITHQEIANLIGSTRETTSATLQKMQAEGILSLGNRTVTVLDGDSLEREAKMAS